MPTAARLRKTLISDRGEHYQLRNWPDDWWYSRARSWPRRGPPFSLKSAIHALLTLRGRLASVSTCEETVLFWCVPGAAMGLGESVEVRTFRF